MTPFPAGRIAAAQAPWSARSLGNAGAKPSALPRRRGTRLFPRRRGTRGGGCESPPKHEAEYLPPHRLDFNNHVEVAEPRCSSTGATSAPSWTSRTCLQEKQTGGHACPCPIQYSVSCISPPIHWAARCARLGAQRAIASPLATSSSPSSAPRGA